MIVKNFELNKISQEKYDLFCKANKEKTYKEGYSQFIGELFNNKMINDNTLEENIAYFVETLEISSNEDAKSTFVEDLLICICKMFMTVYKHDKNKILKPYCNRIFAIRNNKNLPKNKLKDVSSILLILYDLLYPLFTNIISE